jgi:hypothetical protein
MSLRSLPRLALFSTLGILFLAGADKGSGCGNAAPLDVGDNGNTFADAGGCPSGQTACAGACVDLTTDSSNCGACGVTCDPSQPCDRGTCPAAEVPDSGPTCDTGSPCNGACVDLTSDPANCGTCGNPCGFAETCLRATCIPNSVDLDAGCDPAAICNGVCVDLGSDPENCGSCGYPCDAFLRCYQGNCI